MHVVYLHQHFNTRQGAGGTRSFEMAKALVERGHRVTMLCGVTKKCDAGIGPIEPGTVGRGVVSGIDVVAFDTRYANEHGFVRRSLAFLRFSFHSVAYVLRHDFDLLFATSTPLTVGIPGIVMKWFRRKPFVFEVRDLWPELPRAMGVIKNPLVLKALEVLEYLSYHAADRLIALSPGMVEGIVKRGIPKDRVEMIPNGCDLDLFRPAGSEAGALLDFAVDDFVAVYAGAFGVANGLQHVLEGAAIVQRTQPAVKFVLIGEGKLEGELRKTIEDNALHNCHLRGSIPKEVLATELPKAQLGLMVLEDVPAFYYGTSPNKFFDYISSGLPVLTNYPGWVAELVEEHECGVRSVAGDPSDFAAQILRLAGDRKRCAEMGVRARALAERRFSRADEAQEFVDTLETALDELRR